MNALDGSQAGAALGARVHMSGGVLLTADQLAARWQVPRGQVYRLAREGLLPVVRIGRYYRFRLGSVEEFEAAGGVMADA